MLRVNVGLSRKLSKDFNSSGFSINLDGEVTAPTSDAEAVVEQVKELFDLAEEALNQQIERIEGNAAIASRDVVGTLVSPVSHAPPENPNSGHQTNGNGQQEAAATNKQINYLLAIGKRQQLTTAQLEAKIAEVLGRPTGLYDLSKRAAGVVIDALTSSPDQSSATSSF